MLPPRLMQRIVVPRVFMGGDFKTAGAGSQQGAAVVSIAFWFALGAHLMSLGWVAIGAAEAGRPFADQYIRALYWCTTTIATIGYGDYTLNHESNLQVIYTIAVQLVGVGMYGYIIGNIASRQRDSGGKLIPTSLSGARRRRRP